MKSGLVFILFWGLIAQIQAQSTAQSNLAIMSGDDWKRVMRGNQPITTTDNRGVELRGTPFVFDDWTLGTLILNDSVRTNGENLLFKLDVEKSEIRFFEERRIERILDNSRITGLELKHNGVVHVYKKMTLAEFPNALRFVEVLSKGAAYTLVKYSKKVFAKANAVERGPVTVGQPYDSYDLTQGYYIVEKRNKSTKIKLNKSDIFKVATNIYRPKKAEIDAFCKENSISGTLDESQAVKLIAYLNKIYF